MTDTLKIWLLSAVLLSTVGIGLYALLRLVSMTLGVQASFAVSGVIIAILAVLTLWRILARK